MNVIRFLYFIATIIEVAKSSAEKDDVSLLAKAQSSSRYFFRGSGLNDEKETGNQSPKRMLETVTKRLLRLISINDNDDCCEEEYEDKFVASDGSDYDFFGSSCSISKELIIIGASGVGSNNIGAAYLFQMDGTEVAKLTPGNDEEDYDYFGGSVSIDEKVVVATWKLFGGYVQVFSLDGIYEKTIRCDDCTNFGNRTATLGNLIAMGGEQNSISKLFLYTKEGEFINSLEHEDAINGVAISEQFIVSTFRQYNGGGKTIIYSNTPPDFSKIAEINQGGYEVAVSNESLVIGDYSANGDDGAAYLYKTDGTLVKNLDRQDASSGSYFGASVAINDDKVVVAAPGDNDQGIWSGSVFFYSVVTGEFIKKVLAPDGRRFDLFGSSVCTSDSHYMVGAFGDDSFTGSAYLFQYSRE